MFRLHEDGHGTNDTPWRGRSCTFKSDWTGGGHPNVQLLKNFRVLEIAEIILMYFLFVIADQYYFMDD